MTKHIEWPDLIDAEVSRLAKHERFMRDHNVIFYRHVNSYAAVCVLSLGMGLHAFDVQRWASVVLLALAAAFLWGVWRIGLEVYDTEQHAERAARKKRVALGWQAMNFPSWEEAIAANEAGMVFPWSVE